ncbi:hypothetical protein OS493_040060, partial [Desmophyllum pertusum]
MPRLVVQSLLSNVVSCPFPRIPWRFGCGLDTKSLATLWKDVALVEINVAVMIQAS